MTISAVEFLRRFLLHVLPFGFTRIRHFGLCAAANVETKLKAARQFLERHPVTASKTPDIENDADAEIVTEPVGTPAQLCPACGLSPLVRRLLEPTARLRAQAIGTGPPVPNTS